MDLEELILGLRGVILGPRSMISGLRSLEGRGMYGQMDGHMTDLWKDGQTDGWTNKSSKDRTWSAVPNALLGVIG